MWAAMAISSAKISKSSGAIKHSVLIVTALYNSNGNLGGDLLVQLLGTGEAQRAIDEIILVVNHKQITVHKLTSIIL